jgi:ATP-dependent Clp protease ATP-binding subunit ClpA
MFERFTKRARTAVKAAQRLATEADAETVRPEHLLLALLEDQQCLAVRVMSDLGAPPDTVHDRVATVAGPPDPLDEDDAEALEAIGIDLAEVLRRVEDNLGSALGAGGQSRRRSPRFSKPARKVLELSLREALALKHNYIGTEHILLGLARGGGPVVESAFAGLGLSHRNLRRTVVEALRRAG